MAHYEYKVVPAPQRGEKARGVKTAEARFALAIERLMNEMGEDGWEYVRAETLPSEERAGLTGTATQWRNLLVFRRLRGAADGGASRDTPRLLAAPAEAPEGHMPPPDDGFPPMPPLTRSAAARRARAVEAGEDAESADASSGAGAGPAQDPIALPRVLVRKPEREARDDDADDAGEGGGAEGPDPSPRPRG